VLLIFCSLGQVWFSSQSLSESASIFLILTTCFFCGIMANFYVNVYIISRENSYKIGRVPYGVRLIFYNAGRASADVFIYRRRTVPIRYVTTQEKILKNRPVPVWLSNSPVMCTSLKSYDVRFICDHSIRANSLHFEEKKDYNNSTTLTSTFYLIHF